MIVILVMYRYICYVGGLRHQVIRVVSTNTQNELHGRVKLLDLPQLTLSVESGEVAAYKWMEKQGGKKGGDVDNGKRSRGWGGMGNEVSSFCRGKNTPVGFRRGRETQTSVQKAWPHPLDALTLCLKATINMPFNKRKWCGFSFENMDLTWCKTGSKYQDKYCRQIFRMIFSQMWTPKTLNLIKTLWLDFASNP